MSRLNRLRILVVFLLLTNVATVVMVGRSWWSNWWWKEEAWEMAGYAGSVQAMVDYDHGMLRVYEIGEGERSDQLEFTGRRDGVFEVWRWPAFVRLGAEHRFTVGTFVEAYNSKMRHIQNDPEDFPPGKATTKPGV